MVLGSLVVACGGGVADGTGEHLGAGDGEDHPTDAGAAGMMAGSSGGAGSAGSFGAAGSAGGAAGHAGSLGAAGVAGAAGSSAAGTGGSAGIAGSAGAAGSAGSVATAGSGGSAGSAGAAGMGGSGAAGSSALYDCPLGTSDADKNGYPDACERVLATIEWSSGTGGLTVSSTIATASYYVLARALSPADSARYPDCHPDVNAVGQQYPVHVGTPEESRIFDARTNPELQHFIACEKAFLAAPNGVSTLSGLWTQLLFNVHSDWPHDRTNTGSGFYFNSTLKATLTPTHTIVYAKRQVFAYNPTPMSNPAYMKPGFSGRWTMHGYTTPK
jgi:hypothetical protein